MKILAIVFLTLFSCSYSKKVDPGELPSCSTTNGQSGVCIHRGLCIGEGEIGECDSDQVCCTIPNNQPSTESPAKEGCGWRNINGTTHTSAGKFPWIVKIYRRKAEELALDPGAGALIHPRVVITGIYAAAEHNYFVRVGLYDMENLEEGHIQMINVTSVAVPESYSRAWSRDNIALMFLAAAVQSGPAVGYICLPPPNAMVPPGLNCISPAWRYCQWTKRTYTSIVLSTEKNKVVTSEYCQARLRKEDRYGAATVPDGVVCAGQRKTYGCEEGAGPLVCPYLGTEGRYFYAGASSVIYFSSTHKMPRLFTDVSHLRTWIDQEMAAKGYDMAFYTP